MNLGVVKVAMCLERIVAGVVAEPLQAARRDSKVSSEPELPVAERMWGSVRLPKVAPRSWTGSAVVVQCSRFPRVYNPSWPVMRAMRLVIHSTHRRHEVHAVRLHVRKRVGLGSGSGTR